MNETFVTNDEIIQAARRNLGQGAWDYLVGGSESETTMRRNRLAYDKIAFRPRVLVDVSHIDTSTTLLGHKLRMPVVLAPIGSLQLFNPSGAAASARAAKEFGSLLVVSSSTQPSLEETAEASGDYPKVFQLYVEDEWEIIKGLLQRVKEAKYDALCLTVDTAIYSRRERPMVSRYTPPSRERFRDPKFRAGIDLKMMNEIKEFTGLPFMLKGVMTPEDARIAVDNGVDVVWVSNHGGRQLDQGAGAMEALPEIVEAVAGRAEIVIDGAIQRGTDVLKAVALGANAVAIGRLQGWGIAAAGQAGVVRVLEILEAELRSAMGLLGVTSIDQVGPQYVRAAEPVTPPHEMSAWANIPGVRIH